MRKDMLDRSHSMVLRTTFLARDFCNIESISGPESLFDPAYTGNHIVIFECQLKAPSTMALIDNNLLDFFKLNKLSMSNWRIADVDHFMRGASYFNRLVQETDWQTDVEKVIGTHAKRQFDVKDLETQKEIIGFTEIYQKYIDMKEPRSNRGIEVFKSQEEVDAEKKAAKDRAEAKVLEKKAASAKAEKPAEGEKKEQPKKEGKKKEAPKE